MRRPVHAAAGTLFLVLCAVGTITAKGPTVRVTISGATLSQALDVTSPNALVNLWSGTRSARSWFDFPKPFIGDVAAPPDASLPRYTISFYVRTPANRPDAQVLKLLVVRYVPDPQTGTGYIYLPGHGDTDMVNQAIAHPGDGKWNHASPEWSAAINARLAASTPSR
jgi:hypothetical protein